MRKYILTGLVLVGLTVPSRAVNTDQTGTEPGTSPAKYNNNALSFLASTSSDGRTTPETGPGAVVSTNASTNQPQWLSTVTFGLTATAGNSDSALVTGIFQTHKKTAEDEWMIHGDAAYGEASSIENNETLHGFVQYNHLYSDRWYGYARGDALHDGIADVEYRLTFSPGAGYYFVKNGETGLAGEVGPAILYEKLDGEYHTYPTLRLAESFDRKFDEHARLWQNVEFLPPVTNPDSFLVNAEVGVETPLTKYFSLQTYVQDNYANVPAPGRANNDVKLVSALAVKF
jgi:putative salt-induced outer membrane protein YdiY